MSGDDPADQANAGLTFSPVFEDIADLYHGHSNWLFEAAQGSGALCDGSGNAAGEKSSYDIAMPPAFTFDEAGLQDGLLAPDARKALRADRERNERDGDGEEGRCKGGGAGGGNSCGSGNRAVHRPTEDQCGSNNNTFASSTNNSVRERIGGNAATNTSVCPMRLQTGLQPLMMSQVLSFPPAPPAVQQIPFTSSNNNNSGAMPLPFLPSLSPSFSVGSPAGSLGSTSTQSPHLRAQQVQQMNEARMSSSPGYAGRVPSASTHPLHAARYTASPINVANTTTPTTSGNNTAGSGTQAAMAGTSAGAVYARHNAVLSSSSAGNASSRSTPALQLSSAGGAVNMNGTTNSVSSNQSSSQAMYSGHAATTGSSVLSPGGHSKLGGGQATTGPYTTGNSTNNNNSNASHSQVAAFAMRGYGPGETQSVAGMYHGMHVDARQNLTNNTTAASSNALGQGMSANNAQAAPPLPPPPPPPPLPPPPLLFPQGMATAAANQVAGPLLSNLMLCSPYAATSIGAYAANNNTNNSSGGNTAAAAAGPCVTFPAMGGNVWPPQPQMSAQAASPPRGSTECEKDPASVLLQDSHTQGMVGRTGYGAGKPGENNNNNNSSVSVGNMSGFATLGAAPAMPPYYMTQQTQQLAQVVLPMAANNSSNGLMTATGTTTISTTASGVSMTAMPGQPAIPLDSLYVFDSDYKRIFRVPAFLVRHLPPSRLNITRLVLCRHYKSCQPWSCPMGPICKFVHADCDYSTLPSHSVHVNYVWRDERACIYARLPPGASFEVQTVGQDVIEVQPQQVLRTRGSLLAEEVLGPLTCCPDYDHHGVCFLGEDCLRVHRVVVDPTVQGAFKRAPRRMRALVHGSPAVSVASPLGTASSASTSSQAMLSPAQLNTAGATTTTMTTAVVGLGGGGGGVAAISMNSYAGLVGQPQSSPGALPPDHTARAHDLPALGSDATCDGYAGQQPFVPQDSPLHDTMHDSCSTTHNAAESVTTAIITTTTHVHAESPVQGPNSAPATVLTVPTPTHTALQLCEHSVTAEQPSLLPPTLSSAASSPILPRPRSDEHMQGTNAGAVSATTTTDMTPAEVELGGVRHEEAGASADEKAVHASRLAARASNGRDDAWHEHGNSPEVHKAGGTNETGSVAALHSSPSASKYRPAEEAEEEKGCMQEESQKTEEARDEAGTASSTSDSTVTAIVYKLLTQQQQQQPKQKQKQESKDESNKNNVVDHTGCPSPALVDHSHTEQSSTTAMPEADGCHGKDKEENTTSGSYMTIRIALNAHASQVLRDETSLGTLLLLPRHASEAIVLGPVQRDAAEFARLLH